VEASISNVEHVIWDKFCP